MGWERVGARGSWLFVAVAVAVAKHDGSMGMGCA